MRMPRLPPRQHVVLRVTAAEVLRLLLDLLAYHALAATAGCCAVRSASTICLPVWITRSAKVDEKP
jgi:hypothetical protein